MDRLTWIPFAFPGLERVGCAFTTRRGGVSLGPYASANLSLDVGDRTEDVETNKRLMMQGLGIGRWRELHQVHSTEMVMETQRSGDPDAPQPPTGDGLATFRKGTALVIKTADCQPILLAHRSGTYIGALHCGWRGNRAGFPTTGVRAFCAAYDLEPDHILAVRGPSLSPAKSQFVNFDAEFGAKFKAYFNAEDMTVDLWRLTRDQLLQAGILKENIFSIDLCTFSMPDWFFSYRHAGQCGRQAGLIWIKE